MIYSIHVFMNGYVSFLRTLFVVSAPRLRPNPLKKTRPLEAFSSYSTGVFSWSVRPYSSVVVIARNEVDKLQHLTLRLSNTCIQIAGLPRRL